MVARITTVAFTGVDVLDIDVQVQMGSGLPAFQAAFVLRGACLGAGGRGGHANG